MSRRQHRISYTSARECIVGVMTTSPHHFIAGAAVALIACFTLSACEVDSETTHPPREDLDAGWTCDVDADVVRASGTITNHSSKTSFYIVETEFRFAGRVVDHRSTSIDGVEPGETAHVEAISSDVVDEDVTCHVTGVDRFKA
jgi:hypothetical protein